MRTVALYALICLLGFLPGCSESRPSLYELKKIHLKHFARVQDDLEHFQEVLATKPHPDSFPGIPSDLRLSFNYGSPAYNIDFFRLGYVEDLEYGGGSLGSLTLSRNLIFILRDMLIPMVIESDENLPYYNLDGLEAARKVKYLLLSTEVEHEYSEGKLTMYHYLVELEARKVWGGFVQEHICTPTKPGGSSYPGGYSSYESCQRGNVIDEVYRIAKEELNAPLSKTDEVRVEIK